MRLSHIVICVTNWERSLRFYHDQLGFRFVDEQNQSGAFVEALYGLKGVEIHSAILEREGVRIELRQFVSSAQQEGPSPGRKGGFSRAAPFDNPGLTHLVLRVGDLDDTLASLAAAGVEIIADTRAEAQEGELGRGLPARKAIFICDPDGTPLELQETSGD